MAKLLGRMAFRGWRDGNRADRRWAKGCEERLWQREAKREADETADDAVLMCPYGCR
jgi:hypothetical protein